MAITPKKRFGQNFLNDMLILDRIIQIAEIHESDEIIEVGPGRGALTKELIKKAKHVLAYELDRDLISILNNSLSLKKLDIVNDDFLKVDLN